VVAVDLLMLSARRESGVGALGTADCCCEHVPQIPLVRVPPGSVWQQEGGFVRRIRDRVAGLDVHRDSVTAAARFIDLNGEILDELAMFATTSRGVAELGAWLRERAVTTVAMEATGVYWKPVFYGLEGMFEEVWVCNAGHVKNVPGRKTDIADAAWLADVVAHGMVRASFVPPPPIRELRELSRYRKTQIDVRGREIQRLEKVLQDACVKLTSVASTVWSKSSRAMIEALIAGERDPEVLADLALGRMRAKKNELIEALAAHWRPHHSTVAARIIAHIDFLDASINELTVAIGERLDPFEAMITRMCEVPGVDRETAEVVIAETGGDMTVFPSPVQLCSWAGLTPGSHESAGKRRSLAAWAAAHSNDGYLPAQWRRFLRRFGKKNETKATFAVAHTLLVIIWHLLTNGDTYQDAGADYSDRRTDAVVRQRYLVRELEKLGLQVTLEPAA
jgi:transposase